MGENCATAMKFEILGFYRYGGQASAHIVCSIFFQGGGGGLFNPRVGLFR